MKPNRQLAPCLVGRGTVSDFRDMLRALETLENIAYRFIVHKETIEQGQVTLVKLMADPVSATMIVNGCLFLNVASFRFLDFERDADERWVFTLHGDDSTLEFVALPDAEQEDGTATHPRLLAEQDSPDFDLMLTLDDEDEDE